MKRHRYCLLLSLAVVFLLSACRKQEPVLIGAENGQWHLVKWNAAAPQSFDVYLELLPGGTFNLYQKVSSSGYEHLGGDYVLSEGILNGTYEDGTAWACSYVCSLGDSDNRLTLISCDQQQVESVYERTEIPDEVRRGLFDNE